MSDKLLTADELAAIASRVEAQPACVQSMAHEDRRAMLGHIASQREEIASYRREIQTWYDKLQAADAEVQALTATNERLAKDRDAMREKCAVIAWTVGMDMYGKSRAHDSREVGAACAQAIRDAAINHSQSKE